MHSTLTSYKDDVLFQFNGNIVCVITNFFFTKNVIIVHYNKFRNLGVYHAKFSQSERP